MNTSTEKTKEFCNWLADRIVYQYGESPNVDFVQKLRLIPSEILSIRQELVKPKCLKKCCLDTPKNRKCRFCGKSRPLALFVKDLECKFGVSFRCKFCRNKARLTSRHRAKRRAWFNLPKNLHKNRARCRLGKAVALGKIKKPNNCSSCNASGVKLEGHHYDYTKPLDVLWLCKSCHSKQHPGKGEA